MLFFFHLCSMFGSPLSPLAWVTGSQGVARGSLRATGSRTCRGEIPVTFGNILVCSTSEVVNYTSVDPKQLTVSKFRLKPVILISECFCSRCGQRETRPLQSPRRRPHQPTPIPHMKGDNRRQWETTGDKTTSEPKKPTTPTNTKAARSKVALRTPTVNCLGKKKLSPFAIPFFVIGFFFFIVLQGIVITVTNIIDLVL